MNKAARKILAAQLEKLAADLETAETRAKSKATEEVAVVTDPNLKAYASSAFEVGWLAAECREKARALRSIIKWDLTTRRERT